MSKKWGLLRTVHRLGGINDNINFGSYDLSLEETVQELEIGLTEYETATKEISTDFDKLNQSISDLQEVMEPIQRTTGQLQFANENISLTISTMQRIHSYFQLHEKVEEIIKCGIRDNTENYKELVNRIQGAITFLEQNSTYRSSEAALSTLNRQRRELESQCTEEYRALLRRAGRTSVVVAGRHRAREEVGEELAAQLTAVAACLTALCGGEGGGGGGGDAPGGGGGGGGWQGMGLPARLYARARADANEAAAREHLGRCEKAMGSFVGFHHGAAGGNNNEVETLNLRDQAVMADWSQVLAYVSATTRGERALWARALGGGEGDGSGRAAALAAAVAPAVEALARATALALEHLGLVHEQAEDSKSRGRNASVTLGSGPSGRPAGLRNRVKQKLHLETSEETTAHVKNELRGLVGLQRKHSFQHLVLARDRPIILLEMIRRILDAEKDFMRCLTVSAAPDDCDAIQCYRETKDALFVAAFQALEHVAATVREDAPHHSAVDRGQGRAAHPVVENVLRYGRRLPPYARALEALGAAARRPGWDGPHPGWADGGPAWGGCLGRLVADLFGRLLDNLKGKADAYRDHAANEDEDAVESLTQMFLLRNYNYLTHSQRHQLDISPHFSKDDEPTEEGEQSEEDLEESKNQVQTYQTVGDILKVNPRVEEKLATLEQQAKEDYLITWETMGRIFELQASESEGKQFRKAVKEAWKDFNMYFTKVVEQQTGLSLPDEELRAELRAKIGGHVLGKYRAFYTGKTASMNFKHFDKHVHYTPEQVKEKIEGLFSG